MFEKRNLDKCALRSWLGKHVPFDEQEMVDQETMIRLIDVFDDVVTRDNVFGHFTASAFVVNERMTDVVILRHNIFNDCVYPGGHADGEHDLLYVALKEVEEETGLVVEPMNNGEIFSIQCIPVKGHVKNGHYVSPHTHHDVAFLCVAKDEDMDKIRVLESENSEVIWVPIDHAPMDDMADWFRDVYIRFKNKLRGVNYARN